MESLEQLFRDVKDGKLDIEEALEKAKFSYYEDVGYAKIDHYIKLRHGFPEVIFCEGKRKEHAIALIKKMSKEYDSILATRADKEIYEGVKGEIDKRIEYHEIARIIEVGEKLKDKVGKISVICAGTSDLPVAEEAYVTANAMGNNAQKIYDIGIAGLHRLIDNLDKIADSKVVIAVAGMEGALPSVVAGLINKPVIGVPTSVGYGSHFKGIVPLFGMLNSCIPMGVINIDNGFGAAYFASLINKD